MENNKLTNILLVGVGGQGIIVASEIMADAFLEAGYDLKKSEVHGMAQRGGSVSTHVRFGAKVFSPLIKSGEIDILVAFEELEAMRYLDYLGPQPAVILNEQRLNPPSVSLGKERYPENIAESLSRCAARFKKVAGKDLALKAGDLRTLNIVLLGTLSAFLPVAEEIWAKRLKAVVVRGSRDVGIADPKRFKAALDAYRETLEGEVWTETLRRLGTPNLVAHRQKLGIWGAKNFQRGTTIEGWEKISGEAFREKFLHKVMGCMGCLVRCRRYSIISQGPFAPSYTKGPEYDTINALGAKTYVTDPAVVLRAHFLCDEYGIDAQTAGSSIAMAMELYERGLLKKDQVDGVDLVFGNGEALLHFIEQIPFRRGFGDLLAEGTKIMGERLNAGYYAIHVKGLEVDATPWMPRWSGPT